MYIRVIALSLAVSSLAGCGPGVEDGETVGYETRRVTITDVNPPKHFSVDVRDDSGNEYDDVARSKHCNSWRSRAVVGKSYQIPFRLVRSEEGKVSSVLMKQTLNDLLCGGG